MFTIYRDAYINFNDQGPIPFQINFENILPKGFVSYSLQQKVYSADGVHISPSIYKKRRRIIPCRCQNFYDLKSRKKNYIVSAWFKSALAGVETLPIGGIARSELLVSGDKDADFVWDATARTEYNEFERGRGGPKSLLLKEIELLSL